jgi:hypothetical protein
MNRGWSVVEYRRTENTGRPERWPLERDDFWSEPACPGGCQFEVGAPADVLIRRAVTLTNDPDADEDTFILTDIAPAQFRGRPAYATSQSENNLLSYTISNTELISRTLSSRN